jgi:hypothetical protein
MANGIDISSLSAGTYILNFTDDKTKALQIKNS